ncbi:MAG: TRAP transporter small permease [Gammaproteobacteria bacterium]|nr:TRAP transporter small permease [Gammaproteobacteria bacterium]
MSSIELKPLRLLARLCEHIAIVANTAGTLAVLGLVAVVNYDVVARGVFSAPFMGAVEVVQFSLVLVVFLQLPDVVRVNRLTRSDGFLLLIGDRFQWFSGLLRRVLDAIACVFMALIVYAMYPEFTEMWETRDYFGVPGVFTAPWWPVKLTILLSAVLCTLLFFFKAVLPRSSAQTEPSPDTSSEA